MDRPVFWHQGLLLEPHHFQLQERYLHALLQPLHAAITPHFWGTANAEIREAALADGTFALGRGEFLFPDTTHAIYPGNAVIEPRAFQQSWVEAEKPLTVYIGLRRWNENGGNVTILDDLRGVAETFTRFVTQADPEDLNDLYENGPTARINRLFLLLKIFWETEVDKLGDYLLLPVGKLVRRGEDIGLSEEFVPPCARLAGSKSLLGLVQDIRDEVASVGRRLETYKREKGIHTAEFGARDMVYLLALRSLNRYVPELSALVESEHIHPWNAFSVLQRLIGELSSFSEEISALGELEDGSSLLPSYDHLSLWTCFSAARILISRLLREITAGPDYIIRLLFDGTYFFAELPTTIFDERNRFYLVCGTEEGAGVVADALANLAKLGSRELLPLLISRALPGAPLTHLPSPPQELPRRSRCVYFQIDHHTDQWDRIMADKNMALYWEEAPSDLSVELMVVGRP